MKKLYPIGSTWEAKTNSGRIGRIWLETRYDLLNKTYEIWRWSVVWVDGSGYRGDICSSYRACLEEIPMYNGLGNKPVRFKLIKPEIK
jgi:hypothetical protein